MARKGDCALLRSFSMSLEEGGSVKHLAPGCQARDPVQCRPARILLSFGALADGLRRESDMTCRLAP